MDLSEWRARIDTLDQVLVDLINRRMEYVLEIGRIKHQHDRPVRDPEREARLLDGLKAYNDGPLSDKAIEDIFSRIMQEEHKV